MEALGIYRSDLFPQLSGKIAQIKRHSKGWVTGKFLRETSRVYVAPTGEREIMFDAQANWILYHEDDFDIVWGALSSGSILDPETAVRDGAIVRPADDVFDYRGSNKAFAERITFGVHKIDAYERSRLMLIAGSWWLTGFALGMFVGYLLWH
jgi:hypothetical protein